MNLKGKRIAILAENLYQETLQLEPNAGRGQGRRTTV
jgi:hypothetical protein